MSADEFDAFLNLLKIPSHPDVTEETAENSDDAAAADGGGGGGGNLAPVANVADAKTNALDNTANLMTDDSLVNDDDKSAKVDNDDHDDNKCLAPIGIMDNIETNALDYIAGPGSINLAVSRSYGDDVSGMSSIAHSPVATPEEVNELISRLDVDTVGRIVISPEELRALVARITASERMQITKTDNYEGLEDSSDEESSDHESSSDDSETSDDESSDDTYPSHYKAKGGDTSFAAAVTANNAFGSPRVPSNVVRNNTMRMKEPSSPSQFYSLAIAQCAKKLVDSTRDIAAEVKELEKSEEGEPDNPFADLLALRGDDNVRVQLPAAEAVTSATVPKPGPRGPSNVASPELDNAEETLREIDSDLKQTARQLFNTVELPTIREETLSRENSMNLTESQAFPPTNDGNAPILGDGNNSGVIFDMDGAIQNTNDEDEESPPTKDANGPIQNEGGVADAIFNTRANPQPQVNNIDPTGLIVDNAVVEYRDGIDGLVEAYAELLKRQRRTQGLLVLALVAVLVLAILFGTSLSSDDSILEAPASSVLRSPSPSASPVSMPSMTLPSNESSAAPSSSSSLSSLPTSCSFKLSPGVKEKIDLRLDDPFDPNVALEGSNIVTLRGGVGSNMVVSVRDNSSSTTYTIFYSSVADGGEWIITSSFRESYSSPGSYHPVALSGSTAFVGVHNLGGAGSVSVYEQNGFGLWEKVEEPFISLGNASHHGFGSSVDVDGSLACVLDYSSIYLYRRDGRRWVQFTNLDYVGQPEECIVAEDTIAVRGYDLGFNGILHLYKYNHDVDRLVPLQDPIIADVSSMDMSRDYFVYWDLKEKDAFVYSREEADRTFAFLQKTNLTIPGYNQLALDNGILVLGEENRTHFLLDRGGYWEKTITLDGSYDDYRVSGGNVLATKERGMYSFHVEDCTPMPTQMPSISTTSSSIASSNSKTPPSPSRAPSLSSHPSFRPDLSPSTPPTSASSPIFRLPSSPPSLAPSTVHSLAIPSLSLSPAETCYRIKIAVDDESPHETWWNILTNEKKLASDSGPIELRVGGETYSAAYMEHSATETSASGMLCDCSFGTSPCECEGGGVCLIERGEVFFDEKVANCERGGGSATIIYNNVKAAILSPKFGTLGEGSDTSLPVLFISQTDGKYLVEYSVGEVVEIRSRASVDSDNSHAETICLPEGDYELEIYNTSDDDTSLPIHYNITSNDALIVHKGQFESNETVKFSIPFVPPEPKN